MKLVVIGDERRTRKYLPDLPIVQECELAFVQRGANDGEILAHHADASFVLADAISPVSRALIQGMPDLRLIHSEGVAYNLIDVQAAAERGIPVCNCAGMNANAVAEQAILLMLACLRDARNADAAVRAGQQIVVKERMMVEGIAELRDCTIGLIGFGAIARSVARKLVPWGCTVLYNKRTRLSADEELAQGVSYATVEDIAHRCDIVSLHCPVTPETTGMVDAAFLQAMKRSAILVNTARGEIVDQQALADALRDGTIAMAGMDTLSPEPVQLDHPLLTAGPQVADRIVLSPHIGGVTAGFFRDAHKLVWENVARVATGEQPVNCVNG